MRISKSDYEEYQSLKRRAEKDGIVLSAKSITRLEDDIDLPIKNCVAMFALLGCSPVYSCCGFDYDGQPLHKAHQYGRPYIKFLTTPEIVRVAYEFHGIKTAWVFSASGNWHTDLQLMANMNPHWRREDCIHFSEECNIWIGWLERALLRGAGVMKDSVTIEDTNSVAKSQLRHWRYPPKEPWLILKKDVLESLAVPA